MTAIHQSEKILDYVCDAILIWFVNNQRRLIVARKELIHYASIDLEGSGVQDRAAAQSVVNELTRRLFGSRILDINEEVHTRQLTKQCVTRHEFMEDDPRVFL